MFVQWCDCSGVTFKHSNQFLNFDYSGAERTVRRSERHEPIDRDGHDPRRKCQTGQRQVQDVKGKSKHEYSRDFYALFSVLLLQILLWLSSRTWNCFISTFIVILA